MDTDLDQSACEDVSYHKVIQVMTKLVKSTVVTTIKTSQRFLRVFQRSGILYLAAGIDEKISTQRHSDIPG